MSVTEVLRIARGQLGYNGTGTEDAPTTKFNRWYYGSDVPAQWCAIFCSWALAQAGHPQHIETPKGFAYCPSGVNFYRAHDAYASKGWQHAPKPGDLVFFDFGLHRPSHVGIVEATPGDGIQTIEGNTTDAAISRTGNCCRRKWHPQNSPYVLGYATPNYATHSGPIPTPPAEDDDVSKQDVLDALKELGLTKAEIIEGVAGLFHLPKGGLAPAQGQLDNGSLAAILVGAGQQTYNRDRAAAGQAATSAGQISDLAGRPSLDAGEVATRLYALMKAGGTGGGPQLTEAKVRDLLRQAIDSITITASAGPAGTGPPSG